MLYGSIRLWAEERGDVTIIGGWAVHELVESGHAMQSRDVDLVLHTEEALRALLGKLSGWGLSLRSKGRKRFPDAHFTDEHPLAFRLDLFTPALNDIWIDTFGRHGAQNLKEAPTTLFPELVWVIEDKLSTIALRHGGDAPDKRAKDLVDVYHLVFHNKDGVTASVLAKQVSGARRQRAVKYLDEAIRVRPGFEEQLRFLREWLDRPSP